ncbi:sensor histidine kinase [Amycolatopsis jejuensis]|uniref:sensor histidine kinase n=1 Tax=Amycolatopsis jejuensis TaxID=330084 RepID=UPI0005257243|nr:histidine kinase [Amycolatopsis jejuensis]
MREVTRRRWRVTFDVLLWAFLSGCVALDAPLNPHPWELVYGLVSVTLAMVTARAYPAFSLAVGMATALVVAFGWGGRVAVWEFFLMVVVSYLAGLRLTRVRAVVLSFFVFAVGGLLLSLLLPPAGFDAWGAMLGVLAFAGVAPCLLGRHVRLRKELARAGWRRAGEMESRHRLVAQEARLRERARIASDMHDSLGHELSLIAVRAAALEVAGGLDDDQREAAGQLRAGAATATERLREIIGVLREDAAPVEPVQGDPGELVDRARASGIEIDARLDSLDGAPPMVARAVYRVVQEALTNAAKHAPGAAVSVTVTSTAEATDVRVRNAAPPAGPLPGASGQRGLIGLRERVRLVGGSLQAEPSGGGFEVAARLPHDAAPAPEPDDEVVGQAARELELARRSVRWSLVQAIVVPLLLFGVVLGGAGVTFLVQWSTSELSPEDYARITVGTPRADFAALLPKRQRSARPYPEPPQPPGATCEYYGTGRSWVDGEYAAYRLCFADGKLVSKDFYSEDTQ